MMGRTMWLGGKRTFIPCASLARTLRFWDRLLDADLELVFPGNEGDCSCEC